MATCTVNGHKPDTGPGQLTAQNAMDTVNAAHATWAITMAWNKDTTTYTSAVATGDELETAFSAEFSSISYMVTGSD